MLVKCSNMHPGVLQVAQGHTKAFAFIKNPSSLFKNLGFERELRSHLVPGAISIIKDSNAGKLID